MLMSLVFLKVKNPIKLTKIVEIEEVKIQRDVMSFNEIFWENGTYDGIKSEKKTTKLYTPFREYIYFLKYIIRVKVRICFNETTILDFAKSAIFHSI